MEKDLFGKRIAIGASRKTDEMSTLIEKQGGTPVVRSLQGTVFLAEKEVEPELLKFVDQGADWVIFTTGIGIETLLNISEKMGVKERFLRRIRESKIASRGYKSLSALKKLEITPKVRDDDGTTRSLIESLKEIDFSGKKVMVQLHGEKAPALIKFLENGGAEVSFILPYRHILPETETVAKLCGEVIKKEMDAVCFTTATQVRSLFDFAREKDYLADLLSAFQVNTVAVAVGKVTAEALKEEGINRVVVPENERMGAMVIELVHYYRSLR
ncbi:uroporphyrinogen-III synthase [Neobacillus terrae]|uniref:uroporphyrinogen-III synthase n=1 Tax=Neobacillus terrae TaxID=3034837 RepID=UPI00140DA255|nr:uroporphyrinogen-III synthase [Neobacillus terrae]NHM30912.1 uroporphyrinogen-III synthase [Neobacillus terrae]